MICVLLQYIPENFFAIWAIMAVSAGIVINLGSGLTFRWLYVNASYDKWQYKSNAKFPSPAAVRDEALTTWKAVVHATAWPSLAIYFRSSSWTHGYCPQDPDYDEVSAAAFSNVIQFLFIFLITDFYEFAYHFLGHWTDAGWEVHRHHHKHYNPTPFAVIADEWWDNLWRAFPLFAFPLVFRMNIEVLWYTFSIFFYAYGIYLHCGYEADWIVSTKNPLVNTSFQHYIHHATGRRKTPCHCGFFIKTWDQLFGSLYDGPDCHAEAERKKGNRSIEAWNKLCKEFPDYSVMWTSLEFWRDPVGYEKKHGKPVMQLLRSVPVPSAPACASPKVECAVSSEGSTSEGSAGSEVPSASSTPPASPIQETRVL
jgi:lathosterol oxidase